MNPRTIVLSLGAHVVVIGVLVALKAAPAPRAPTTIRITESKPPTPKSNAPKPKPKPKPKPQPKARPKPKPKAKARPARRTAKARPRTPAAANPSRRAAAPAPMLSGLILGNADGPGMAIDVAEGVARGPTNGTGGGDVERLAAPIEPIQPRPPPAASARACARIERPRVLSRPQTIRYTPQARAAGAEGRMVLRLHVDARGRVARVEVQRSVHPALDREAVAAARTWRFAPEVRCGRAAASTFVIARRFELTD